VWRKAREIGNSNVKAQRWFSRAVGGYKIEQPDRSVADFYEHPVFRGEETFPGNSNAQQIKELSHCQLSMIFIGAATKG
jgi:hypothetical protein